MYQRPDYGEAMAKALLVHDSQPTSPSLRPRIEASLRGGVERGGVARKNALSCSYGKKASV